MNVERLRRLENLLRADAANPQGVKFDLGNWAEPDKGSPLSIEGGFGIGTQYWNLGDNGDNKPAIPMSCDTKACALGLAALDPDFQKEGLNYKFLAAHANSTIGAMIPTFEGDDGMHAGAAFFGISREDSSYLFDPANYDSTPREADGELFVADRIAKLIDGDIDEDHHPDTRHDHDEDDEDED